MDKLLEAMINYNSKTWVERNEMSYHSITIIIQNML